MAGSRQFFYPLGVAFAASLTPYFYAFHEGFSRDPQAWAAFGTYANGVITPLTVFAAVLAVMQSDNARRAEAARFQAQSQKADLLRFIEKIEKDITEALESLPLRIEIQGRECATPMRDALLKFSFLEWKQLIPSSREILDRLARSPNGLDRHDKDILAYEICGMVSVYIERLRAHCDEYDSVAGNCLTSQYFARKYRVATERLNEQGYILGVWAPSAG